MAANKKENREVNMNMKKKTGIVALVMAVVAGIAGLLCWKKYMEEEDF